MNPVFLDLGFFKIRYYGLMYAVAFLVGTFLARKEAKRRGIDPDVIESYAFAAIIGGLVGARLYYVLLDFKDYSKDLMEIFAVWHGGMAIHGGIIGGIIATLIFGYYKKMKPLVLADIAAPLLLLGQCFGRIGNLMNGDAHGVPTITPISVLLNNKFTHWWSETVLTNTIGNYKAVVPWGIIFPSNTPAGNEFPGIPTHPTMIYEMILNFICFLILWFGFRKKKMADGSIAVIYLVMYSVIRSVVTMFRADDLMVGTMRAPHLISLIMMGAAILFFIINKRKKARE